MDVDRWEAYHSPFEDLKIGEFADFPGGPVVENPPCNSEDKDLIPGWRTKIPHAMEQLNPCATTAGTVWARTTTREPAHQSELLSL